MLLESSRYTSVTSAEIFVDLSRLLAEPAPAGFRVVELTWCTFMQTEKDDSLCIHALGESSKHCRYPHRPQQARSKIEHIENIPTLLS